MDPLQLNYLPMLTSWYLDPPRPPPPRLHPGFSRGAGCSPGRLLLPRV